MKRSRPRGSFDTYERNLAKATARRIQQRRRRNAIAVVIVASLVAVGIVLQASIAIFIVISNAAIMLVAYLVLH